MSLQDKTIYPSVPKIITTQILKEYYTPTKEELEFSLQKTITKHNQLLFLVSFKLYQNLGYFIKLHDCPEKIIAHTAEIIGINSPKEEDLFCYDKTSQKDRYVSIIRQHYETKLFNSKIIFSISCKIAKTKNAIVDIINGTIEDLISNYYELPSLAHLEQSANKAKSEINNSYYEQIYMRIPKTRIKKYNDDILIYDTNGKSIWNKLKTEPSCPTVNNVRDFSAHLKWLQTLNLKPSVFADIPYVKLECMLEEGISLDFYKIKRIRKIKKIALVAVVVKMLTIKATDDLIDMLIRLVNGMRNDSKNALLQFKIEKLSLVDKLMQKFGQVLRAYKTPMGKSDKLKIIDAALQKESEELITLHNEYTAYNVTTFVHFMEKRYNKNRKTIMAVLELLEIETTSRNSELLNMLKYIKHLDSSSIEIINNERHFNKEWLSRKWMQICKESKNKISRARFEIYVLLMLCDTITSRENFIKNAHKYADFRTVLVSWREYNTKIEEYQNITNISAEPNKFCQVLKDTLQDSCHESEDNLIEYGKTTINSGKLKLKKITAKTKPEGFSEIEKLIESRMDDTSLLDIVTYSCKQLNLHKFFSPISGIGTKIDDHIKHVITTIFCYGCNIDATEGEKSIVDINRKQIGRINATHITEQSLDKAINHVINIYNKFQLPRYWGDGKHVSVDGTKWETYSKNLMAQYHIRYRGYGGIAYYHVSDTYIATYSNFIACGVHESRFLLDGIVCGESDIKAEYIHGDSHAQSFVVFGLAYLLGIKVMPRIRRLNELAFFKINKNDSYGSIDVLFSDKVINWKLIFDYTKEMFRVAISIKEGKVKPSEILSRICASNSQNKLYMAFRELGRVIRTSYLLDYISDFNLRKVVHAATCKSEEFNEYVNWIAFADDKIKKNNRVEQRKFIKYNHLVTNMVLLFNVKVISMIVNDLIAEGYVLSEDILKFLSPYRKSHIVRLGIFELNMELPGNSIENWSFDLGSLK